MTVNARAVSSTPMSFVPSRRKRRPALACEECRRRKIRCDRHSPCTPCRKAKIPNCFYIGDDRVDIAKAPFEARDTQFSVFEQTLDGLVSLSPGPTPTPMALETGSSIPHQRQCQRRQQEQEEPFNADLQHVYRPEESLEFEMSLDRSPIELPLSDQPFFDITMTDQSSFDMFSDSRTSWDVVSQTNSNITEPNEPLELYPSLSHAPVGAFYKGRFLAQSHWINYAHQPVGTFILIKSREGAISNHHHNQWTFSRCKAIRKAIKERKAATFDQACSPLWSMIPARAVSDQLLLAYLRTFHAVLTVLHVPTFLKNYSDHWKSSNSTSEPFVVMLLLVLSIGSSFCAEEAGLSRLLTSQWIKTASNWLVSSKRRLRFSLDGLRIQSLLLLAQMVHGLTNDASCFCTGSLYRTALYTNLSLSLKKEGNADHPRNQSETQTRRHLWFTIVELDLQASMDRGSLPIISDEDTSCPLPSNMDDVRILDRDGQDPNDEAACGSKSLDQYTHSSLRILLGRTLPVRIKIARFLNSHGSEYSFDTALGLSAQLLGQLKECHDLIEGYSTASMPPNGFQIRLLDLFMRRFILSLHHPFAVKAMSDPRYAYSRQLCIDTSMDLLSHLTEPDEPDFRQLEIQSTGVFSNVYLQSALYLTGEITNTPNTGSHFLGTSQRSDTARKEMKSMVQRFNQLALDRVAAGETNIKRCVLASCLLAQAEANQEKASVQISVSRALDQILEKCGSLLEAQLKALMDGRSIENARRHSKDQLDWLQWDRFLV